MALQIRLKTLVTTSATGATGVRLRQDAISAIKIAVQEALEGLQDLHGTTVTKVALSATSMNRNGEAETNLAAAFAVVGAE